MVADPSNKDEEEFFKNLLKSFLNYQVAFTAKLQNDQENGLERKTELSLVMAMPELEPAHALLVLQIAVNNLYKLGNFNYCAFVARKFLKVSSDNPEASKTEAV